MNGFRYFVLLGTVLMLAGCAGTARRVDCQWNLQPINPCAVIAKGSSLATRCHKTPAPKAPR